MVFATRFFTLALLTLPSFAAPAHLNHTKRAAKPYDGIHLVLLRDGVSLTEVVGSLSPPSRVTSQWDIINGFACYLSTKDLPTLMDHPGVVTIQKNRDITPEGVILTQHAAPWNLNRISTPGPLPPSNNGQGYTYSFDSRAGEGVDVYVLDSGIYTSHILFGGRAFWGATFTGTDKQDGTGHGTHCAGIIASSEFGVAKKATVIAVKVVGDDGMGTEQNFIDGVNWIYKNVPRLKRPSVASGSLGADKDYLVDLAVIKLIRSGVSFVASAGNGGTIAWQRSPGGVELAITVGSSDIDNNMAGSSNYGISVNIIAPGVSIRSTSTDGGSILASGTSMAAAHVTGIIAGILGIDNTLEPRAISITLDTLAIKGAIIMSAAARSANTPNKLAWNGISYVPPPHPG